MNVYREAGKPDPIEERRRIERIHNAYPDVRGMPSRFNPSGLVPYPCEHGIPVKPARFPQTKGGTAWLDEEGNEKPPFAGRSWGRAKHLRITVFGGRDGIPFAVAACPVCVGEMEPEDMTRPANE